MARPSPRDDFRLHPVVIALAKARAAHNLLEAVHGGYLQLPVRADNLEDQFDWIRQMAADVIEEELATAEAEFRKSLTPQQAFAQVTEGPKAVA